MVFRDSIGNILEEGDRVSFGMGVGQTILATVAKLSNNLGSLQNGQPAGIVHLQGLIVMETPNGNLPVIKATLPEKEING